MIVVIKKNGLLHIVNQNNNRSFCIEIRPGRFKKFSLANNLAFVALELHLDSYDKKVLKLIRSTLEDASFPERKLPKK